LAGLKQQEESPAELASIAFYNALYGKHPYAHPSSGVIKTVSGFKAADLRHFIRNITLPPMRWLSLSGFIQTASRTNSRKVGVQITDRKKPDVLRMWLCR